MSRVTTMWLAIGFVAGMIACGASFVGPATHSDDPHEGWTDCHDGTWCPPAYPQCPFPGSGWKCQAPGPDFVVPDQVRRPDAGR